MATKGQIDILTNALGQDIRYPIQQAFYYTLDNLRLGDQRRAQNMQWYQLTSTTASIANTEFSIAHGLSEAPKWLIPVLDLTKVNAQIVPLQVSRAPDAQRIYLKSASTSAVFTIFVEV